ncbi:MAG: DEAD/DEAH box helicase [Betaproteobacteria bacterium]|nr:DEAD/DEAH box helicase [Betaproteobacteria bacterium]
MSFASLNLLPELLRAVEESGYTEPTPIQAKAIPVALERRDIMGCAQTGTGKTASFTLPLLQMLAPHANTSTSPARHPVRALVLTPTRELAAQVEESVKTYSKYLPLRAVVVYGGVDIKPQIKALQGGIEIVVATPGRLLDHLQGKSINLSQVQFLVLDEADRMLDMGFLPDLKRILSVLPATRQNLLFSATFSDDIKKLAREFLRDPVMIEVARRNAPAELVTHQVYEVPGDQKQPLLEHLVKSRNMEQVLVFARMKRDTDRLARALVRNGFAAAAIHSDRTQSERTKALDDFKKGDIKILVATDVAARGIDIDQLPFVINYEIPNTPEDYVHRIGRTGRAGTPGEAISLVSGDEMEYLARIEKLLKRAIPRIGIPDEVKKSRGRGERSSSRADGRGEGRGEGRSEDRGGAGEERGRSGHRASRDEARPHARKPPRIDAPHFPKPDPSFDFTKPYEPQAAKAEPAATAAPAPEKRKAAKPVAALFRKLNKVDSGV